MTFIKWGYRPVWHIERSDGFAVCGYRGRDPVRAAVKPERTHERPAMVCANCDRMKDATTVQLRKDPP